MRDSVALTVPSQGELGLRAIKLSILGRDRSRPHLGRKFYHFVMGIFCFSLYAFVLTRGEALLILSVVGGALLLFDILRFRSTRVNSAALMVFGRVMRREELKSMTGNSFYVLGLFFVALIYPKPIALLSILFLAVGDPIAAVVGTTWGKHRLPFGKKSWEGAIANFVASTGCAYLFSLFYLGLSVDKAVVLALVGGAMSTIAELIPSPIDDNFTIPALSGGLVLMVNAFFPLI